MGCFNELWKCARILYQSHMSEGYGGFLVRLDGFHFIHSGLIGLDEFHFIYLGLIGFDEFHSIHPGLIQFFQFISE